MNTARNSHADGRRANRQESAPQPFINGTKEPADALAIRAIGRYFMQPPRGRAPMGIFNDPNPTSTEPANTALPAKQEPTAPAVQQTTAPAVIPTFDLGSLVAWLVIKHQSVRPIIRRFTTDFPGNPPTRYVQTQLLFVPNGTDMSDVPDWMTPPGSVPASLELIAIDPLNQASRLLTELQKQKLAAGDPTIPVLYPN